MELSQLSKFGNLNLSSGERTDSTTSIPHIRFKMVFMAPEEMGILFIPAAKSEQQTIPNMYCLTEFKSPLLS